MERRPTWLAPSVALATAGFGVAAAVLGVASWRAESIAGSARLDDIFLLQFPALPVVGWLLASKRPANPIGWLFLTAGLATTYASFADAWGRYGLVARPGSLPAGEWVLWTGWVGAAGFVLPAVFVVLLFPDGRLPSPRWRPVGWTGAAGAIAATGAAALRSGPLPEFRPASVPNPAAIDGADAVLGAVQAIGAAAIGGAFVAAAASLAVRYRHADRRQRGQLSFLAVAAAGLFVTIASSNLLTGGRGDDHPVLGAITGFLLLVGVPAAIAAAILWRGLYDIDRLVRRSVVYGLLWLAITVVYVGVAWAVGLAAGDRFPVGVAILLTVVVTVVFEPSRRRLGRLADRWVFGPRPDSYELTAALSAVVDDTDDLGHIAHSLAELAARGVDAMGARVRLLDPDVDHEVSASYPAVGAPPAHLVTAVLCLPLTHRDTPLGALECGPKRDGDYTDDDHRLLELLAREAALAVHGLRLAASLAAQVDTVRRQADELTASRSRIVAAQEAERRRIERNIHDGVQQGLVALIAKVRLARDRLDRDPLEVATTLASVQDDVGRVLRDIRDLAQGIHPTVLADQGLARATEDRTARLPLDVRVHADTTVRQSRYDDPVEGAAYFVVSEALANTLKHAHANHADVHLSQDDGHLRVEVTDDGCGFQPGTQGTGTGIVALADRLEALGGHLRVNSQPEGGTTVIARLPARPCTASTDG